MTDDLRELEWLKKLLREEIDHAAFNGHVLDPSGQGWEPNTPVVRVSNIEACLAGAARRALSTERSPSDDR